MHGPRRPVRVPRPRADTDNASEHRLVAPGEGGCCIERAAVTGLLTVTLWMVALCLVQSIGHLRSA